MARPQRQVGYVTLRDEDAAIQRRRRHLYCDAHDRPKRQPGPKPRSPFGDLFSDTRFAQSLQRVVAQPNFRGNLSGYPRRKRSEKDCDKGRCPKCETNVLVSRTGITSEAQLEEICRGLMKDIDEGLGMRAPRSTGHGQTALGCQEGRRFDSHAPSRCEIRARDPLGRRS